MTKNKMKVVNVLYLRTNTGWGFKCAMGSAYKDPETVTSEEKKKLARRLANGKTVKLLTFSEVMREANGICQEAEKSGHKIGYNVRMCFDLKELPRDDNQMSLNSFT